MKDILIRTLKIAVILSIILPMQKVYFDYRILYQSKDIISESIDSFDTLQLEQDYVIHMECNSIKDIYKGRNLKDIVRSEIKNTGPLYKNVYHKDNPAYNFKASEEIDLQVSRILTEMSETVNKHKDIHPVNKITGEDLLAK